MRKLILHRLIERCAVCPKQLQLRGIQTVCATTGPFISIYSSSRSDFTRLSAQSIPAATQTPFPRRHFSHRGYFLGGGSPHATTASHSPASRLPQEVVDMIIAHLIYDRRSLWACSFASRSCYSAAVPHLHRTLTTQTGYWANGKIKWPKPLRIASQFCFLPFVTRVSLSPGLDDKFSAKQFSARTRREFSALTNCPGTLDQTLGHPQLHPEDQRVFWTVLTNPPISHPNNCERDRSAGCVLHRTISALGGR